jgi:hypothetical protein
MKRILIRIRKFFGIFEVKLSTLVLAPVLLIPVACMAIYMFADAERDGIILPHKEIDPFVASAEFNAYWYAGEAEITSYKLDQARYGEMHEGTAVLMFVAEDFSTKELTKSSEKNGEKLPVLKVNYEKKFVTGIYPYSILMTAASPIDIANHPLPLKIATSCQEWCGHTYTQLNMENGRYEMTEHSYFPGEGDHERDLGGALPEDAIWTRLRIAPDKLPVGKFELIPSTIYARLRHKPLEVIDVSGSYVKSDSAGLKIYQLDYADGSRELKIWYDEKFPYGIAKWEENYEEGWGPEAKHFTTTAVRMHTKKLAYWDRHKNVDRVLRGELGL